MLANFGYIVSGNHVFSVDSMRDIYAGKWRPAVIEAQGLHPAKIARAARLLSLTY